MFSPQQFHSAPPQFQPAVVIPQQSFVAQQMDNQQQTNGSVQQQPQIAVQQQPASQVPKQRNYVEPRKRRRPRNGNNQKAKQVMNRRKFV